MRIVRPNGRLGKLSLSPPSTHFCQQNEKQKMSYSSDSEGKTIAEGDYNFINSLSEENGKIHAHSTTCAFFICLNDQINLFIF